MDGSVEEVMIFCRAKFGQVAEVLKKREFIHTQCRFTGVTAGIRCRTKGRKDRE